MKKVFKWFSIFAVIGAAIGLVVAYFCRNSADDAGENETDFTEDEDFDLDADLQPAEREYVSLSKEDSEKDADAVKAPEEPAAKSGSEAEETEKTEETKEKEDKKEK